MGEAAGPGVAQGAGRLVCEMQGDVAVVGFLDASILDERNIKTIGDELIDLVDRRGAIRMVLDFGRVRYLSSAVLGKIIALHKKLLGLKGAVKLCNVRPEIRTVFKVTQLDKVVDIHEDLAHAVNSFKRKSWGLF